MCCRFNFRGYSVFLRSSVYLRKNPGGQGSSLGAVGAKAGTTAVATLAFVDVLQVGVRRIGGVGVLFVGVVNHFVFVAIGRFEPKSRGAFWRVETVTGLAVVHKADSLLV